MSVCIKPYHDPFSLKNTHFHRACVQCTMYTSTCMSAYTKIHQVHTYMYMYILAEVSNFKIPSDATWIIVDQPTISMIVFNWMQCGIIPNNHRLIRPTYNVKCTVIILYFVCWTLWQMEWFLKLCIIPIPGRIISMPKPVNNLCTVTRIRCNYIVDRFTVPHFVIA